MSTGQLLLVILAVVLFSTLIVSVYNSMAHQNEMAYETTYQNQAINVADAVCQRLESEYLGKMREFETLFDSILDPNDLPNPNGVAFPPMYIQGIRYTPIIMTSTWWSGLVNGHAELANNGFVRLTCNVEVSNMSDTTFTVGNDLEPAFSKVIADIYQ